MTAIRALAAVLVLAGSVRAGGSGLNAAAAELAGSVFKNSVWGVSARYADTGGELVSFNREMKLVPASSLKIFVTGCALEILGPGHRFATRLYYNGKLDAAGELDGDIYIAGGGDPTLGSALAKGAAPVERLFADWLGAARQAGIKKIKGSVIADSLLFSGPATPGSWTWEDIGNYYAAQPTALALNDNSYQLYFKSAAAAGGEAQVLRTVPAVPGLKFINYMRTGAPGSGDNGYIYCAPGQYTAVLRGTIPAGQREFAIKGAIPEPADFAAQYFTDYLRTNGMAVEGAPKKLQKNVSYDGAFLITETLSPPLKEIVRVTNKRSFNFYAEMLLRALAAAKSRPASLDDGLAVISEFLSANGMDSGDLLLSDASGLSRLNLATPRLMTDFLVFMSKSRNFGDFYASLAYPGDAEATGHIKRFGKGTALETRLRIKSGSLPAVRSYCGYVKDKKGRLIAFASLLNNYTISPEIVEKAHEDFILRLAE